MATDENQILNTWDQLKRAAASGFERQKLVAISYHHPDHSNSRDVSTYKWSVWSPFFKTDPDASWYDNDSKTFGLPLNGTKHHERKATALTAAMNWANEKYGPYNWVRNQQGDYVPKEVNDRFPLRKRER